MPSRVPQRYAEMPLVQLKTGVNVGYSLCEILGQAEQSIVGTAYCFDYPEGCRALAARQRSGVKVRVLLDHGQHLKPSCVSQADRVAELSSWGVEFKTYKPPTGDKSCMHVKSWVCDGEVLIGGSANFTRNGIQNNVEHLIITRDDESITLYLEWLEHLWLEGSSITDGRSFLG
jgi:phosphatidylserine/phosphatidylglycerophosphate/cardiolipin synthase-like enzyme